MTRTLPLPVRIARLVSSPSFQRASALQSQPCIFNAVARTHTETWHSSFLGWLLSPTGSHGLGTFPLSQFLLAVAGCTVGPGENEIKERALLTRGELALLAARAGSSGFTVHPSEDHPAELGIPSGKKKPKIDRFDVVLEAPAAPLDEERTHRVRIIVEVKVDAPLDAGQAKRYGDSLARWIGARTEGAAQRSTGALVFLGRSDDVHGTSEATTDDSRWYCLDYQQLHDDVLIPCVEHPALSTAMRPLLEHYLINLRSPRGRKGRMCYTDDEKRLALEIFDEHRDTLRELAELVLADGEHEVAQLVADATAPVQASSGRSTSVELVINGKSHRYPSVVQMCQEVVRMVYNERPDVGTPFGSGRKRYFVNDEPLHQDGSPFTRKAQLMLKDGTTLYYESNHSRQSGLKEVTRLLEAAGYKVTVPEQHVQA